MVELDDYYVLNLKHLNIFYFPATKWPGHTMYSVAHVRNSEIKQLRPLFFSML
jgi:hypothetical protein